jgi:hypothetical protein
MTPAYTITRITGNVLRLDRATPPYGAIAFALLNHNRLGVPTDRLAGQAANNPTRFKEPTQADTRTGFHLHEADHHCQGARHDPRPGSHRRRLEWRHDMIPPATARKLRTPPFEPSTFKPTKCSTTEDKAWFANTLLKFLANDSPQSGFTSPLYRRLSLTFGHIAHMDKFGFYETFFQDDLGKLEFLRQTIQSPFYGDPHHTFSDAERAIAARVKTSGLIHFYEMRLNTAIEHAERAKLAQLKAKYEPSHPISAAIPSPFSNPPQPLRQGDLFGFAS